MNSYEVLGVNRKARLAEIKKVYRRLARKYHPDLNPGDKRAEERFKQITEAYEILSNPDKRRAHDRELEFGGAATGGGAGSPPWEQDLRTGVDLGDLGGFASIFSEILGAQGAGARQQSGPRKGGDVTHALRVGFFDALRGLETEMSLEAESACPRCNGSGTVPSRVRRPCPDCAGTGRINHVSGMLRFASSCRRCNGEGTLGSEGCGHCRGSGILTRRETLKVHIPAGVDNGSRVRVSGRGRAGRNGGAPGDLYIITQVEPHPFFRRIGDNIYCTVPITVSEAALGTRLEVPTIDGKTRIRIPPGTESDQKFRLRGKGAPSLRGTARGDQYVEVRVVTPPAADERSRQILRELGDLHPGDDVRRGILA
ncbi:MAG TPA: J domain-containing protein [Candidatus Polarisedimenticolia bacterium]|nr:J domain-containing protein [Candidatus Polarisedimenticolia bacterium]